jgi:uncharacterized membrane protein
MLNFVGMYKNIIPRLKTNADIILVTLLGVGLRAKDILRYDLWYDEAFTGNLMRVGKAEFWKIVENDPHPPLFSLLLKSWTSLIGVNDFTLRILPLVFGVLTIVLVYFFCKEIFNKETATLASALTAINPFLIEYSVDARSYSLFGLLTLLAAYFIAKKKAVLFVITAIIMIYTHYMAIVFLPPLLLYYFWTTYRDNLNGANYKNKVGWIKNLLILVPFFVFAVFLYYPVITSKTNNNLNIDWVKKASIESIPRSITAYSYGVKSKVAGSDELMHVNFLFDEFFLGYGIFAVFLAGIAGVLYTKRKEQHKLINFTFTVAMVFLPMAALISYVVLSNNNIYVERYLLPASIFFIISLAYILTNLLNFEVAGVLLFFYVFTLTRTVPAGYYTGMKILAKNFKDTKMEIVFTSPIDFVIGKYYINNGSTRLFVPKEPTNQSYYGWPFIGDTFPRDINNAVFISPDMDRMTGDFTRPIGNFEYGNYQIWLKNN